MGKYRKTTIDIVLKEIVFLSSVWGWLFQHWDQYFISRLDQIITIIDNKLKNCDIKMKGEKCITELENPVEINRDNAKNR